MTRIKSPVPRFRYIWCICSIAINKESRKLIRTCDFTLRSKECVYCLKLFSKHSPNNYLLASPKMPYAVDYRGETFIDLHCLHCRKSIVYSKLAARLIERTTSASKTADTSGTVEDSPPGLTENECAVMAIRCPTCGKLMYVAVRTAPEAVRHRGGCVGWVKNKKILIWIKNKIKVCLTKGKKMCSSKIISATAAIDEIQYPCKKYMSAANHTL